jgi:hypothetical protein
MRRIPLAILLTATLALVGCSRDFILDPPHDSPRDPLTPGAPGVPPLPTNVTAESITQSAVTLRWTMSDSSGVSTYRIYMLGPGETNYQIGATTTIQRGKLAGLQAGQLYRFRIGAVNTTGLEGALSDVVSARPAVVFILINNNAEVTSNPTVSVTMTAVGFDQIRMSESVAALPGVGYQNFVGSGPTAFTLSDPDGAKTIYAQFRDSNVQSESEVVSDDILLDRVARIDSVLHNAGTTPRTAGFIIHFRLKSGEPDGIASLDIGAVRTGIPLFDDGTNGDTVPGDGTYEYNYAVEPTFDANAEFVIGHFTDRAGNVAPIAQSPVLITIQNPPPPVILQSALSQGRGQVLLQWTQSGAADFQTYRVWHATTSPVLAAPIHILDGTISARTTTTLTTDSLAVGILEHFVVEVVDAAGNSSASNELTATPTVAEEAPAAPAARGPQPALRGSASRFAQPATSAGAGSKPR